MWVQKVKKKPFFLISLFHILHSTSPYFSLFFFFSNLSYLSFSFFLTSEASSFTTFILYYEIKKKRKEKAVVIGWYIGSRQKLPVIIRKRVVSCG